MSEAKFTPGPWEAKEAQYDQEGDFKWWLFSVSYGSVGYWTGHKQDHQNGRWLLTKEDAHLIAAAPEIYEALQDVLSLIAPEYEESPMVAFAKSALTKATGEVL